MRVSHKIAILLTTVLLPATGFAQGEAPEDGQPMVINGIETVCTGTTTDVREDPRWRAYSLRLEFAGKDGQYLGDETVNVSGNGHSLSVHCSGPWVLMKLPSGSYKVSADVAEGARRECESAGQRTDPSHRALSERRRRRGSERVAAR